MDHLWALGVRLGGLPGRRTSSDLSKGRLLIFVLKVLGFMFFLKQAFRVLSES